MAHYAKVVDGKVTDVIVAEADFFKSFVDSSPGEWIQTSYNTRGNKRYDPATNMENPDDPTPPLRGNFAGIGYTYDKAKDVFYAPSPFPSWVLNESTWLWEAPVPAPTGGEYIWDEETKSWIVKPAD